MCRAKFERIRNQKYCSEKCKWEFYKKTGKTKIYRQNNRDYRIQYMKEWHKKNPVPKSTKVRVPWNKGLTKEDPRVAKYAEKIAIVNRGKKNPQPHRKGIWTGSKNPRWKGGVTAENARIRNSKEYVTWRNAVWNRDKSTCQECKYSSHQAGKMIAHHIKGFAAYPELRFEVSNGITLCRPCHAKVDHNIANNFFKTGYDPRRVA